MSAPTSPGPVAKSLFNTLKWLALSVLMLFLGSQLPVPRLHGDAQNMPSVIRVSAVSAPRRQPAVHGDQADVVANSAPSMHTGFISAVKHSEAVAEKLPYFRLNVADLFVFPSQRFLADDILALPRETADMFFAVHDYKLYARIDYFTLWSSSKPLWTFGLHRLLRWMRLRGRPPLPPLVFAATSADFATQLNRKPSATLPVFSFCKSLPDTEILFPSFAFAGWSAAGLPSWEVLTAQIEEGLAVLASAGGDVARRNVLHGRFTASTNKVRTAVLECIRKEGGLKAGEQEDVVADDRKRFLPPHVQVNYTTHLYVPGLGCSASMAPKLASGGTLLSLDNAAFEFFSRPGALVPGKHYVPIAPVGNDNCPSLLAAARQSLSDWTDWTSAASTGDAGREPPKYVAIAHASRQYMAQHVSPDAVYAYMEGLLRIYAGLLDGVPSEEQLVTQLGFVNRTTAAQAIKAFDDVPAGATGIGNSDEGPVRARMRSERDAFILLNRLNLTAEAEAGN